MRVFIFEQIARNILCAICSKIKTVVLPTFLGQKMFDIELNMLFCPKNVSKTRIFIIVQTAHGILWAICSKIKTRVLLTFLRQNRVFS